MTSSGSFTCPACGANFDVQERLGQTDESAAPRAEKAVVAEERTDEEAVSFQCPACGADYDTQEALPEETEARQWRRN